MRVRTPRDSLVKMSPHMGSRQYSLSPIQFIGG